MANYIVPQVLINQLISEVPLNTVRNQNVLVFGPNYQLFRFSDADEKAKTYLGEYVNRTGQEGGGLVYEDADGEVPVETSENVALRKDNLRNYGVIAYPNQAAATVPDADYSKLFADEVTIKIASLGEFFLFDDETTAGLDARFRFPYVIASNNKDDLGRPTSLYKICDSKINGEGVCVGGNCGLEKDGIFHWEIVVDRGDNAAKRDIKRSINPGDVIRIPYSVAGDTKSHVYRSTVVEVLESVEGSGVFDTVLMADMLPDEFIEQLKTHSEDAAPTYNENSVAWECQYFDADDDNTIGPADDDFDSNDCDPSNDYGSDAGKDIVNTVQLCAQFSDVQIERKTDVRHVWNWSPYAYVEAGAEDVYGVVVTGNLRVPYLNWGGYDEDTGKIPEYRVLTASLYVEHRDLIVSGANEIESISSHTLVESTLGTVHPDNPLAFGVYMAALNSGDRLVYYAAVQSDDLNGYNLVLDKATLTDDVYIITPTTMDLKVIQSVKAHCLEMSTAQNKLWRIGFVAMDPPDTDTIYDRTNKPSGEDFFCRLVLSKGKDPVEDGANIVQFMKGEDPDEGDDKTVRCLTDVQVGDVVKIWLNQPEDDWDDTPHYTERYVSKVLGNNMLQLTKGIRECDAVCLPDMTGKNTYDAADIGEDGKAIHTAYSLYDFRIEVYRKLTPAQQVKYIADQSSSLATRRMYNVFPSIASNDGVVFDGSFLACAAAGLVSSVLPQQPLTNVELNGVDDIPVVYQTYTKAQLDAIAAGGTFIIMQDRPGAQVYVRHQISTDYTSNNLLKSELSITKNLDSISYFFAERFAPYIGKYNITPDLIGVLSNVLTTGLTALENDTAAGLYGPQVIEEGTEILWIRQSEAFRDHVECRVHLNLPVPFNYFDLDLEI